MNGVTRCTATDNGYNNYDTIFGMVSPKDSLVPRVMGKGKRRENYVSMETYAMMT